MTTTRLLLLLLLLFAAPLAADELITTEGDKLVGTFEKLEGGEVYFITKAAGLVKVPAANVASITIDEERDARMRLDGEVENQQDVKLLTKDGQLHYRTKDGETPVDFAATPGINETLPDNRPIWDISGLGTFSWTEGNTRTYALGYRFDIKRTTKHNFNHLFARGNYFQDRNLPENSVRERNHHIGYLYRYIFDFNLTIDLTQDFYFNEFAGYNYRSVTGLGPGYYIVRKPHTFWHAAAHLTYTYEDQLGGGEDRGYFGARLQTEFDWVSPSGSLHVNYKGALMFDFDETKNLTGNQSLLVEHKLLTFVTAGLLIEHAWDNLPPPGFKHHDFRFTFTLGFAWSMRGV